MYKIVEPYMCILLSPDSMKLMVKLIVSFFSPAARYRDDGRCNGTIVHQPPNPIRLEWDFPKPVSLLSLWLPSGACPVLSSGLSCIVFRLVLYCLQASGLSCIVCRPLCCLWGCCPVLPVSVPSLVVAFWDSCPGACIKALSGGCFGQT